MDDASIVGRLEPLGDLEGDRNRLVDGDRPSKKARGQILALDELDDQKVPAVRFLDLVDAGDVGMAERSEPAAPDRR
jgi:hypothetical protein